MRLFPDSAAPVGPRSHIEPPPRALPPCPSATRRTDDLVFLWLAYLLQLVFESRVMYSHPLLLLLLLVLVLLLLLVLLVLLVLVLLLLLLLLLLVVLPLHPRLLLLLQFVFLLHPRLLLPPSFVLLPESSL